MKGGGLWIWGPLGRYPVHSHVLSAVGRPSAIPICQVGTPLALKDRPPFTGGILRALMRIGQPRSGEWQPSAHRQALWLPAQRMPHNCPTAASRNISDTHQS